MLTKIEFLAPRACFKEPAPEVLAAAVILRDAVDAHIRNDICRASDLFAEANNPIIYQWARTIFGARDQNVIRFRKVDNIKRIPKDLRPPLRKPTRSLQQQLVARDGYHCRFCGMPVIHERIRRLAEDRYPSSVPWTGRPDREKHAAFLCMWMQFDHVIPHSVGGETTIENMVITCAPCNYGRWYNTLEELGLMDPRERPPVKSDWDGLERFSNVNFPA